MILRHEGTMSWWAAGFVFGWLMSKTWSDPGCQTELIVFLVATAVMFLVSFARTLLGNQVVDLSASSRNNRGSMISLLLHVFRLLPFLFGGHRLLALGNLVPRQQLTIYKRTVPRPKLRTMDRLLWVGLARVWTDWRQALVIVSLDPDLRRQRSRLPIANPPRPPAVCGPRMPIPLPGTGSRFSRGSPMPSGRVG